MAKFNKIFRGEVKNGNVSLRNPDTFGRFLDILEGETVEVVVRKPKKQRTLPQNGYYWGVIIDRISKETGMLPDEVHDVLKSKFLKKDVQVGDEVVTVIRSTSDLDRHEEWPEYMRRCRQYANEMFGLFIPQPNEAEVDDTMYAQAE